MNTSNPKHAIDTTFDLIDDEVQDIQKYAIWSLGLSILALTFSIFTFVLLMLAI